LPREKPALCELPLEPFRYYRFGKRTVNLDGCVEVEAAYYSAPRTRGRRGPGRPRAGRAQLPIRPSLSRATAALPVTLRQIDPIIRQLTLYRDLIDQETRPDMTARFRDPERSLDSFDFDFNKKMNRALVYGPGHRAFHQPG
jgi:hypothetical protein